MGIRKSLARLLLGKQFVHSAIISNFMQMFGWQAADNPEALVKKVQGWVYTCINKNATGCAQVPLRLYTVKGKPVKTKKGATVPVKTNRVPKAKQAFLQTKLAERMAGIYELEEITEHPILDLLRNVNPSQNAYDLKENTFRYLDALGVAYWWLEKGVGNEVINIWPLMAHKVTALTNKEHGVVGYKYGQGENATKYEADEVIQFRYTSLTDPFLGDSPLKAGEQAADLHDAMNRYEIASFKNGGRPDVVLSLPVDGFMGEPERKRVESEYRRKYQGVDKQGKLMVISGGAELKEIGFSPKDMSFLKGRQAVLEEICGAFGVPIAFVKIQDISRANAWAAMDMWAQYTLNPRLVMVEQKLNEQFTRLWGDNLFLLFDDARPQDHEQRLAERKQNIETKYSSINEERAKDGLEPVAWGEEPVQPVQPAESVSRETPPKNDDGKAKAKAEGPSNPPPRPEEMPTIFRTTLTILFKRIEGEVINLIEQYNDVKGVLAGTGEVRLTVNKATAEDLMGYIFDKAKWEQALEADAMPFIRGILVQSMVEALEKLNPDAVFNASSPEVLRALENRKGEIKSIITTTGKEIRNAITTGIGLGESRGQLIKRIRKQFDARFMADRVVRTETIWAHNEGTVQAWKQSGVVSAKRWDTVIDDRNCPYCATMDGKVLDLEGSYFQKGDTLTVKDPKGNNITYKFDYEDVRHPPLHPNCRCQLIPILVED